jgi:predicted glutamine amidotransferase
MTYDELLKGLNKIKKQCKSDLTDKSIVIHFRIGTHGANDQATTHPFPITSNYDDLRKTKVTSGLGLAHNGIISTYYYDKILSDTQAFVKDFLAPIKRVYKDFYKDTEYKKMILRVGGHSKFAILNNDDQLYILGEFEKQDGVYYSNGTYKDIYRYASLWDYDGGTYSSYTYTNDPKQTNKHYIWNNGKWTIKED